MVKREAWINQGVGDPEKRKLNPGPVDRAGRERVNQAPRWRGELVEVLVEEDVTTAGCLRWYRASLQLPPSATLPRLQAPPAPPSDEFPKRHLPHTRDGFTRSEFPPLPAWFSQTTAFPLLSRVITPPTCSSPLRSIGPHHVRVRLSSFLSLHIGLLWFVGVDGR